MKRKIIYWSIYILFSVVWFAALPYIILGKNRGIGYGIGLAAIWDIIHYFFSAVLFCRILKKGYWVGILFVTIGYIIAGTICLFADDHFIKGHFMQWFVTGMTLATVSGLLVFGYDFYHDLKKELPK